MSPSSKPTIGLTLSGGGFRATIFHLGIIKFLYDAELLQQVKQIYSVSGGSILAAHLVLNWSKYTGDQNEFQQAAQELIRFGKSDIRGRIVRRRLFCWLTLIAWGLFGILCLSSWYSMYLLLGWLCIGVCLGLFIKFSNWFDRTGLLIHYYDGLYRKANLRNLDSERSDRPSPALHLLATNLTTGQLSWFEKAGFSWLTPECVKSIDTRTVPISLAVAASSAFPMYFTTVRITNDVLRCSRESFPVNQYLTDGGVFDNLGISALRSLRDRGSESITLELVSDAQGLFDWKVDKRFNFLARQTRASDVLMQRVSQLEYEILKTQPPDQNSQLVRIHIGDTVSREDHAQFLEPEEQSTLAAIRTDLDDFDKEVGPLIGHGYSVARKVFDRIGPTKTPELTANALPIEEIRTWLAIAAHEQDGKGSPKLDFRDSQRRPLRLFAWNDLASYLSIPVLIVVPAQPVMVLLMNNYATYQAQLKREPRSLQKLEIASARYLADLQEDSWLLDHPCSVL